MYFNPNWTTRLPLPLKILPAVALGNPPSRVSAMVADGLPRLKWLKASRKSARNCRRCCSVIARVFCTPISQFHEPGPYTEFRSALPHCQGCGARKSPGIEPLHTLDHVVRARLSGIDRTARHGVRPSSPPADNTGRHGEADGKRSAGAIPTDPGNRPATGDALHELVRYVEFPSAPDRQVVQVVEYQRLARNAVGVSVVRHLVVGILGAARSRRIIQAGGKRVLRLEQESGGEPLVQLQLELVENALPLVFVSSISPQG